MTALNPVVVADGRVFATATQYFQAYTPLLALNINDGSTLWSHNFGSIYRAGHPAVVDGKVYVQQNKGSGGTTNLWTFDATTGSVAWLSPFGSQWERFWSPLVVNDRVYINGGTHGGLYGFDAADGAQLFFSGTPEQYDEWTPAYRNGLVYTFVGGSLRTHHPDTGAILSTVTVAWDWAGWSMKTAPVFGASSHAYVIAPPSLHAIDTASDLIAWSANANFTGAPAVAGDVVYAISALTLQARDAATGSHLWTFPGDLDLQYPPIIANGFVYVASQDNVYAVDTATHTAVWTAPVGGWLSIAAGKLFVARPDGVLSAFDLSP